MSKRIALPLVCIAFLIGLFASYSFQDNVGLAQKPDYAKWGNMAITIVKENYPEAEVKEYKYEGRKAVNAEKAEDTFLFDVKRGNQPVKVRVVVSFNPKLDTLQSLSLQEVRQQ